jgi:CrcB protein
MKIILSIAIGGALGAVARYGLSLAWPKEASDWPFLNWPWATFIANISGCLLIGVLTGLLNRGDGASETVKYFLLTGFCGGYTTFSTFSLETLRLMQNGQNMSALLYLLLSAILGISATFLGLYIASARP